MVDHSQQWGCHCKHRKERMERTGWKARLYMKCFCLLLAIAIWRVIFVLRYSFMGVSQEQIVVSNSHSQETSESPLIHASQKRESLRSSISLTPTKLSTFQLDLDVALLHPFWPALSTINNKSDPCAGKYVYMYDLPSQFNQKMLEECNQLSPWTDMCKFTANAGLGPRLEDSEGVFSKIGWFATNQFALDVIFHNRMKQYECLTQDSRKAAVLYVPFYAGLDISRHLWNASASVRDFASLSLANWLQSRPEWKVMGGQDHFLVGGRITWDFRRLTEDDQDWGNKLLQIPAILNMTMLVVEASPWHNNDFGIPYPTYFHPTQDSDVLDWQNRMRTANRLSLFSFAGAPRPEISTSIRSQIMNQCKQSSFCKLLECDKGESKCHSPNTVMKLFQESVFCLQPQGDSFTRRSIFDSMVAGCIPVFFHTDSAYSQYIWHLPQNQSQYSIFIPEDDIRKKNVSLESILLQIPSDTVKSMRDEVISLIPGLVYADPRYRLETLKDAFDITVKALIDKVTDLRVHIVEGRELEMSGGNKKDLYVKSSIEGSEQATRRWEGKRRNGEHEWIERDSSHPLQNGQILKENVKKRPITTSLED